MVRFFLLRSFVLLAGLLSLPDSAFCGQAADGVSGRELAYGVLVDVAADAVGLESHLVRAVITVESAWWPEAVSSAGAVGLFQIMPSTAGDYVVGADLRDPVTNISIGVVHLRRLVDRYGVVRALAAWNAGEGALARSRVFSQYRETRRFVARVLQEMERLQALEAGRPGRDGLDAAPDVPPGWRGGVTHSLDGVAP